MFGTMWLSWLFPSLNFAMTCQNCEGSSTRLRTLTEKRQNYAVYYTVSQSESTRTIELMLTSFGHTQPFVPSTRFVKVTSQALLGKLCVIIGSCFLSPTQCNPCVSGHCEQCLQNWSATSRSISVTHLLSRRVCPLKLLSIAGIMVIVFNVH